MLSEILLAFENAGLLLVQQYGVGGLFVASALGSTIFVPLSSELLFPVLIAAGFGSPVILLAATSGAVSGTLVNYWVGLKGMHIVRRYVREPDLARAQKLMNRYGWAGLFVALAFPVPLPTDPLTVLCGITAMRPSEFIVVVALAKLMKYSIFLGLLDLFF